MACLPDGRDELARLSAAYCPIRTVRLEDGGQGLVERPANVVRSEAGAGTPNLVAGLGEVAIAAASF